MRGHAKPAVQRFSSTDRRRLERALSVAREARLYRRIEAVLLVAEGQPISEAARRMRATRLSVRRWVERYLALPWHFRRVLRKSPVAVRATIRNRRRSEQLGDDGAADLRQRGLRRWPVAVHLFPPAPQPSSAGVAGRRRRCRSSARAGAGLSRTGPRSRRGRVPASVADVPARRTSAP